VFVLTSVLCRGGLLHTDPQERTKTTTASSDCRQTLTPIADGQDKPEKREKKQKTEKHGKAKTGQRQVNYP